MENIEPIGFVVSPNKQRYETPHQGVLADDSTSVIRLNPGMNYEQALKHLDGFDMIWVIYLFHLNSTWKPMVTPPRNNGRKVGVFATRSPHRPNNIGLSCVRLLKVEGLDIHISGSDILDGSPVLDIKPYIPYSDSFPSASTGWIKTDKIERYSVEFTETAIETARKIMEETGSNLTGYAKVQLAFEPNDTSRKRIKGTPDGGFCLSYKEWRINYKIELADRIVSVISIEMS
ncbi:MAG: hypothetical protein HBSAPP04_06700 [Ignavibacteriaceae bacterium]|nr:MAG: hypothetical protein HBSAPP04_06700 [Ignavibacteriaceae bacterium]